MYATLSTYWGRWRRRRFQAFLAAGLPRQLSWKTASVEAQSRQRAAAVIGDAAARDADLQCIGSDESTRFVLVGDRENLTREQCAALDALNCPGEPEA